MFVKSRWILTTEPLIQRYKTKYFYIGWL